MRTAQVFTLLLCIAVPAFSSEVSAQEVRQLFAAYDKPNSPGCSVGVIRDGKFLYRESYGAASLELGVPLTSQSVFYMASVSKQFTAASVLLAAERGYLSLDDDVRKYIPELPDYGHPITLRQMLHHTSGLRDFLSLVYLSGREISDLASSDKVLKLIARQKGLNNVPGAEFIYSNSNYFLLGVVIQRATKKSLAEFAAQNIFQPLGMAHTLFYDDNTLVVPGRVAAYDPGENGKFKMDWSTTYDIVGGGGLMSTVDDLLLWDNNFYANKLGKAGLVKELETRGVLNDGKQINYAMGLWLGTYRGAPTVEHSGGTFGYRTELLRFPEQHVSVIALCNVANANVEGLSRQVASLFLGGTLLPEPSARVNAALPDPAPFAGTYLDPRTHVVYTFTVVNGKLTAWGSALRRFGPNQFNDLVGNPITFEEKSGVMSARLDLDGETYFEGSKVRGIQLTQSALNAFAGEYRSEELDANYKLTVEQGSLILRSRDQAPLKLNPVSPAEFQAGDLGTVVFHTDTGHRVDGLTLFSQAARGIGFTFTPGISAQTPAAYATGANPPPMCVDNTPHKQTLVRVDNGVGLEVLDWGGADKPATMVLLTGLGDNAHVYDQFAFQFTDYFHVVGITRRGYAPSSQPPQGPAPAAGYDLDTRARDDIAILDALGIRKAVFVGHSISASELSTIALKGPERVDKLVYLDAFDLAKRFQLPEVPDIPYTDADNRSLPIFQAADERLENILRPVQASCLGVIFDEHGKITGSTTPAWVPAAIMQGVKTSAPTDWAKIEAPRLGIFDQPSIEARMPYYWYLDAANKKTFDQNWPGLVKWYTDRINEFSVAQPGRPKPIVYRLPDAPHYFFLNDQAFVVRVMREFLLGKVTP